jgi:RNA ligase
VKLKFAEYLRVHKLMSEISSITIWEHLSEGKPLDAMLEGVPDEFYEFIRSTVAELTAGYMALLTAAASVYDEAKHLDRKSAAALVKSQDKVDQGLVFGLLSGQDISEKAWKLLRPVFDVPKYGI